MTIETPHGDIPIVESAIGSIEIPECMLPFCDTWGNIKKTPERKIEQLRGSDFIRIHIIKIDPDYYFGFQIKLKKLILQKEANVKDEPYKSDDEAVQGARLAIHTVVSMYSKTLLSLYLSFDKICYNQPELF